MALTNTMSTAFGETRTLYVRINNMTVSNHGEEATVLFRAYLSEEAFKANGGYVWELEQRVMLDVTQSLWAQAYIALKSTEQFHNAQDC